MAHLGGVIIGAHALVGMDVSVQSDVPDHAIVRAPAPGREAQARRRPDGNRIRREASCGRSNGEQGFVRLSVAVWDVAPDGLAGSRPPNSTAFLEIATLRDVAESDGKRS